MSELTHVDDKGKAKMVDVTAKSTTERKAVAKGTIIMKPSTLKLILDNEIKKGDVIGIARIAGIMAAKKVCDTIPLCHPINISSVEIAFDPDIKQARIDITSTVKVAAPTGVEIEAMSAVLTSALTVYDMCKAVDREMLISNVRLVRKSGGKSGDFVRKE